MSMIDTVFNEDCLTGLKNLPDESIDCCVTSPPYFGLRDYGTAEQIGLEETPEMFVDKLVQVFEEVKRVLKHKGTLWLNLGDSYATGAGGQNMKNAGVQAMSGSYNLPGENGRKDNLSRSRKPLKHDSIKSKDLIGIPWMVAFALRSAGWYLRQDIIWHKPNPMPESVTDRCTKSHEYIFLLSKSDKYYYDYEAIKTVMADTTVQRLLQGGLGLQKGSDRVPGKTNGAMKAVGTLRKGYAHRGTGDKKMSGHSGNRDAEGNVIGDGFANKRSVWTITTKPYSEAHFATFPQDLIVDCIKAGCPEGGIVLDPFMGAFTTALVAKKLNRHYVGFELNPEYIKIGNKRLHSELGMFI